MNRDELKRILSLLYEQKLSPTEGLNLLKNLPYEDLDFARIDHHRHLRSNLPEVVYCQGKSPEQISLIIRKMVEAGSDVLATKLIPEVYQSIKKQLPDKAVYHENARSLVFRPNEKNSSIGLILIVTAGTADIPVAEEAAVTADLLGSQVDKIFDVGVAGIHRLLTNMERFEKARAVITVAGMDGALPGVVAGLIDKPVIAVPTSVGYGASFNGVAALLTMLNSCAAGVAVVNIDNGFGAACMAHKINLLGEPTGN